METTIPETQLPALTETGTNAVEVFIYDVGQANQNQATWWNSVSHHFNNLIDAVKSCGKYLNYIIDCADAIISDNKMPAFVGTAVGVSLFIIMVDWYRNR